MSNKIGITNDEITAAQELLRKAGCSTSLNPSVGTDLQMYAAVLAVEKKMLEEIRQIYGQYQDDAEWRWRDNKDDKRVAREIRASLGLED